MTRIAVDSYKIDKDLNLQIKTENNHYVTFYFKHHRDVNKKLFATTCTFIDNNNKIIAVGVSICSDKDNFSRKRGRDISFNRAMIAYTHKESRYPVRRLDALSVMKFMNQIGLKYKSSYFGDYNNSYTIINNDNDKYCFSNKDFEIDFYSKLFKTSKQK